VIRELALTVVVEIPPLAVIKPAVVIILLSSTVMPEFWIIFPVVLSKRGIALSVDDPGPATSPNEAGKATPFSLVPASRLGTPVPFPVIVRSPLVVTEDIVFAFISLLIV
jgi:hypothetical protein